MYSVGGNENWYSHSGKQYVGPSKKKKENETALWSSNYTFEYIQEGNKIITSKRYSLASLCILHHCSQ